MKSETNVSREGIENQGGKVLKENSIIDRSLNSAKLFIVQDYTENAKGDVTLIIKMCDIFSFFEFKVRTCFFFVKDIFIL